LVALDAASEPRLAAAHSLGSEMKLRRVQNDRQAEFMFRGKMVSLHLGEQLDVWTLVEVLPAARAGESERAVLEDYTRVDGDLIFLDAAGNNFTLAKSAEPTSADSKTLYLGYSREEILNSETDLLAKEILAKPGDPSYEQVATVFEPLRKMPTYSFVGTPDTADKVGFQYGGRSANFDPAPYDPPINAIREQGKVLDGLVGGYLPILRFVYAQENASWSEMIAFVPFRIDNGNDHVQPVWYRVSKIEKRSLKWAKYIDSYHPFPPRTEYAAKPFYTDLARMRRSWERLLQQAMKINLPDHRLLDMAIFLRPRNHDASR